MVETFHLPAWVNEAIEETEMLKWKTVDSAPKAPMPPTGKAVQGIYLLGFCPDEGVDPKTCICIVWWEPVLNGGCWVGELGSSVRPTHWMHLPAPPDA